MAILPTKLLHMVIEKKYLQKSLTKLYASAIIEPTGALFADEIVWSFLTYDMGVKFNISDK